MPRGAARPTSGALYAARRSASSQPGATSVSLLSSTTSRSGQAAMPSLALAGNPPLCTRRSRRIRPDRSIDVSASTKAGSGDASSTATTSASDGMLASTLSRQSRVRRRWR